VSRTALSIIGIESEAIEMCKEEEKKREEKREKKD
jgi:hypothetical protein